jgi:hypothetical protein
MIQAGYSNVHLNKGDKTEKSGILERRAFQTSIKINFVPGLLLSTD